MTQTATMTPDPPPSTTDGASDAAARSPAGARPAAHALHRPGTEMLSDTINHWAHHRGQMTAYLRLMGAKVPALYGPSADDNRFD